MKTRQISEIQLKNVVHQFMKKFDANNDGSLNKTELANMFNTIFNDMGRKRHVTEEEAEEAIRVIDKDHNGKIEEAQLIYAFRQVLNRPINSNSQQYIKNRPIQNKISQGNNKKYYGDWENQVIDESQKQVNPQLRMSIPQHDFVRLVNQALLNKRFNSGDFQNQNAFPPSHQFQTPRSKINSTFRDWSMFNSPRDRISNEAAQNYQNHPRQVRNYSQNENFFRNYSPQYAFNPQQYNQQLYPGSPKYTDNYNVNTMFSGDKRFGNYMPPQYPQFYGPGNYPRYTENNQHYPYPPNNERKQQKRRKWNKYKYGVDKNQQGGCLCGKWGSC